MDLQQRGYLSVWHSRKSIDQIGQLRRLHSPGSRCFGAACRKTRSGAKLEDIWQQLQRLAYDGSSQAFTLWHCVLLFCVRVFVDFSAQLHMLLALLHPFLRSEWSRRKVKEQAASHKKKCDKGFQFTLFKPDCFRRQQKMQFKAGQAVKTSSNLRPVLITVLGIKTRRNILKRAMAWLPKIWSKQQTKRTQESFGRMTSCIACDEGCYLLNLLSSYLPFPLAKKNSSLYTANRCQMIVPIPYKHNVFPFPSWPEKLAFQSLFLPLPRRQSELIRLDA